MNTTKFVSLEGEERSPHEQIQYLTQQLRSVNEVVNENTRQLNIVLERLAYLEQL